MARDAAGNQIKVTTGTRDVLPDAQQNRWKGAVTFPNGSVYFPTGDYFILPNGYKILNGPNAKADIDKYIKEPRSPNGGLQYPSGQGPRNWNGAGGPPSFPGGGTGGGGGGAGGDGGGKGQPGGGTPPPPPSGGGPTDTPTPNPTDGPQGPGTGGNFAKGQPRYDQLPGGIFSPSFNPFYGSQGWNPWGGGGGDPYAALQDLLGGAGQGGSGFGQGIPFAGTPMQYDPLGIGQQAYMNDSADYYGMTGVNAVTGAQSDPRWGIVGGQGGYGVGMVGPDYSGPLWNSYPDLNLLQQRQMLTAPTNAQQSPEALPAPHQQTTTNTQTNPTNTNTNGSSNVPSPKGQPGPQQQPAPNGQTGPQSYYEAGMYNTPYGQLVASSSGNQNLYKQNGSDGSQLYAYDPTNGWQATTRDNNTAVNPYQYAQQAGAQRTDYQKKNGFWQAKQGTGTYA